MSLIDLRGKCFGRLVVKSRAADQPVGTQGRVKPTWNCECDCGAQTVVHGEHLRSGHTTSCGCFKAERIRESRTTHGDCSEGKISREWSTWANMKNRCYNSSEPAYKNYGGRGIRICDRWLGSFENFLADMGRAPLGTTIERNNVNRGYEPSNCRWATPLEQARNKRNTIWVVYKGERIVLKEVASREGLKYLSLYRLFVSLGNPLEVSVSKAREFRDAPRAPLTDSDVASIKSATYYRGINQDLARQYGRAPGYICNLRTGQGRV